MGRVGAVGANAEEEEAKGADSNDRHPTPCHPGTILEQSMSGPSLSKGKKTPGKEKSCGLPISWSQEAAHCSQAKTRKAVLWLVDTGE